MTATPTKLNYDYGGFFETSPTFRSCVWHVVLPLSPQHDSQLAQTNVQRRRSLAASSVSMCMDYKSSAPLAADAARYPRTRKMSTKFEDGRKKRPTIGAISDLILPRATFAELIALAADAARYLRARKMSTKYEEGRKQRPMIWCS